MSRRLSTKFGILMVGATTALCIAQAQPARAERVISDYEASLLTLDALTAAPVAHHVVYHRPAASAARYAHAKAATRFAMATRVQVRSVAYHVKAPVSAHPVKARRHHT